jgi:hypothetical protein
MFTDLHQYLGCLPVLRRVSLLSYTGSELPLKEKAVLDGN